MSANNTVKELQQLFSDVYGLYLKTQSYHWHIKGPHFKTLHEMLEEQYEELAEMVDELAERIVMLGSQVASTFKSLEASTNITDADPSLTASNMLSDLASDQDKLISGAKTTLAVAHKENDLGTEIMVSELIPKFEKTKWFLENHLA